MPDTPRRGAPLEFFPATPTNENEAVKVGFRPSLLRFKIDDFESLPSEDDSWTLTEAVRCCDGRAWKLQVYPGGEAEDRDGEGEAKIGLYLVCLRKKNAGDVTASCTFILRDASGNIADESYISSCQFRPGQCWGFSNVMARSKIIGDENDILVDGALIVDVELRIKPHANYSLHLPPNPHTKNMLTLLKDSRRADVAFKVGNTKIFAHKLILEANAPILYNLCGGYGKRSPVPMSGISASVFELVLRYIYGGDAPEDFEVKQWGKQIIDAANRFELVGLKMATEAKVVELMLIRGSNAIEWMLFADAMTCPAIKEYALALFAARPKDFLESEASEKLKESPALMQELIVASSNTFDGDARYGGTARTMAVYDLREALHKKGLDVDGSKQMLITRLESSNKRQRTE